MRVKITTTTDTLDRFRSCLCRYLDAFNWAALSIKEKVLYFTAKRLVAKITSKIGFRHDGDKPCKMTLDYDLVYWMHILVNNELSRVDNDYENAHLQMLLAELDKGLMG